MYFYQGVYINDLLWYMILFRIDHYDLKIKQLPYCDILVLICSLILKKHSNFL
jgi:hypothetical protein